MKKWILGVVALFGVATLVYAQGLHRYLSNSVFYDFVYYVETPSTDVNPGFDGQIRVDLTSGSTPNVEVYDSSAAAYVDLLVESVAETITGAWTFTGAQTFNGNVTLGDNEDDLITVNSPVEFEVIRESFDSPVVYTLDLTGGTFVASVADTNENILVLANIPIYWRYEIGFAGTYAPETFIAEGTAADAEGKVFLIDNAAILDVADNDGIEYTFGGHPTEAVFFDEDQNDGLDAYCEVSVRFDDISDISANDFYFGAFLAAAVNDTFAYESADTFASFGVLDTAGDLVIQTNLNGAGVVEDDSGITLADDATHVLRVEMSADAVAFYIDGTAVTQTNAVLNADAGDLFVCRLGIRSAGASAATLELEYVEIGKER